MGQKTLILIDGHALAYRMYFALERTKMRTSTGLSTWAVYGFFKAIFDLLKEHQPDAIAVSFDLGRKTFRTEAFPEYKANRDSMPDSLREQMSLLFEGVKALDIPIYQLEGFEADDVIGTICSRAKELGHKAYILTGDRDSFQLVDKEGNISVLIPSKGELIEYDWDKVHERMGVYPDKIIDLKGLSGDASDNIPGVKGIGDKTAIKLLDEFGTIEGVLENIENIKSQSQRDKLITDREMAIKSKFLATIDKNVPIEFDFEHTHLTIPNLETITDFLRKTELYTMLKMLPGLLKPFNNGNIVNIPQELLSPKKAAKQTIETQKPEGQLGFDFNETNQSETLYEEVTFETDIITDKDELSQLIKTLKEQQVFSLDTETTSVDTMKAELVGISVAWNESLTIKDGKLSQNNSEAKTLTAYIPVGHKEGEQLPIEDVLTELKPILEDSDIKKVLQNAKYEINVLKNYDIKLNGIVFDTMLASYVKDPTFRHGLKQQALTFLKFQMKDIEELIGKGKSAITMDLVKIQEAADYACADAFATLELGKFYIKNLDESQNNILYDIEFPLVSILADVERNGVSIDTDYLKELSDELEKSLAIIEAKIYEQAGQIFNVNSPKQVGDILFEKMQIPAKGKTKTKTGYSTSAKVLESLAKDYPITGYLLEQRHLAKIKSTYIDALPLLISEKDNRIHTSFNQTVTTTGRLSSSNPNLQNIPIRTEVGNRIRAAFVPKDKENSVIISADYSQIELRLLAHFSKDPTLTEAFINDIDVHTSTASKVFGVPLDEVTKEMRRKAKAVNFGIIYGQTSYGLSESIGITPGEAKEFIAKYFETYPKIKEYMEETKELAHKNGYVETLYGRKRYLGDDLSSRNRMIREFAERAAINAPLQGTAADLIKIAMIHLDKNLKKSNTQAKMILQVHDELILEVAKQDVQKVSEIIKTSMELGQPLDVPLTIDIQSGPSWMESTSEQIVIYN